MTPAAGITIQEVLGKIREKLKDATDDLRDMEEHKAKQRLFRRNLSDYLTHADSVLDVMKAQGRRYAKQKHINKLKEFNDWWNKQLLQVIGTDVTWVYLRAARQSTVHVEKVDPNHLTRVNFTARIRISSSFKVEERHADGTVTVIESPPEPPAPQIPDETRIEKNLWAFQPITDDRNGKTIMPPLNDDVVSLCKAHIKKLRLLIRRCKRKLQAITP